MSDFKERLVQEEKELLEKVTKLDAFMKSDKFGSVSTTQRNLLNIQYHAMCIYEQCLIERLEDLDKQQEQP